jgi:hypothetical protein
MLVHSAAVYLRVPPPSPSSTIYKTFCFRLYARKVNYEQSSISAPEPTGQSVIDQWSFSTIYTHPRYNPSIHYGFGKCDSIK